MTDVGSAMSAAVADRVTLGEHVIAGGWSTFRRATETPFNLVLEARP